MKPILFNTQMVKAILDGRKTQTRRIAKLQNIDCPYCEDYLVPYGWANNMETGYQCINEDCMHITSINQKPKYKVGDILWVRESAKILGYVDCDAHFEIVYQFLSDGKIESLTHDDLINKYKLEDHEFESKYLSKKYIEKLQKIPNGCLKEMARIFLKVTNVRVERLHNILVQDIIREGYYNHDCTNHSNPHYFAEMAKKWWINLWNSTAKDGYKYEDNPPVFVYEFERVEIGDFK